MLKNAIILMFLMNTLFSQEFLSENQIQVAQNINDLRKILKIDNFKIDTTLTKVSQMVDTTLLSRNDLLETNKLDSIRKLLRDNQCFDYQVKYIELKGDKLSDLTSERIRKMEDLYEVIANHDYNKLGMSINNGNTIKMIFSQNYIEINPWRELIGYINIDAPPTEIVTIKGNSKINQVYCKTYSSIDIKDQNILKKEKIVFKRDKYFELKFDVSEGNINRPKSFSILDSKGKIIAFIEPL